MNEVGSTTKVTSLTTLDYVVIDTGYVGRLVGHFLDEGGRFRVEAENRDGQRQPTHDRVLAKPSDVGESKSEGDTAADQRPEAVVEWDEYHYNKTYDCAEEPDYTVYSEQGEVRRPHLPLYISDDLHGEGMYRLIPANDDDDASKAKADTDLDALLKCIADVRGPRYCGAQAAATNSVTQNTSGTIGFACPSLGRALQIARNLAKLQYCACFDADHIYRVDLIEDTRTGKKILLLDYDCESG